MRRKWLLWGQRRIEKGAWFFAPFSVLFASAVFSRNFLYRLRWLPVHRVDCTVVSVGNILAGGTGKTPFVHLLASTFHQCNVAILSRGYGQVPDEAMLLQNRLPKVKVYAGKDRVLLAKQAVKEGADLIILDDGFQHRRLHRDFDIVLLGEKEQLRKNHFLPWGFLRDFPARLKEADAVFSGDVDFHKVPVRIVNEENKTLSGLEGKKVGLFCGLGFPESFKKTVKDLGALVVSEWILADHEKAPSDRLAEFSEKSRELGACALVTTEKDFVKLEQKTSLPIWYVEIVLEITAGAETWGISLPKSKKNR